MEHTSDATEIPVDDGLSPVAENKDHELSSFRPMATVPFIANEPCGPLSKIDQNYLSSRVQAAIREILAKDLLSSLRQQHSNDSVAAGPASPRSASACAAVQRRHAKYMLVMSAVIGEFLKSMHLELSLSVFAKEIDFYFTSNGLTISVLNQQLSDISPLFAELNNGMSLFRIIDFIGIAPYSKFGRQLQQNLHSNAGDTSASKLPDISRASQHREAAEHSYHVCTKTFLFQMLKAMEVSGVFDSQADVAVQADVIPPSPDTVSVIVDRDAVDSHDLETQQFLEDLDGRNNDAAPAGGSRRSAVRPTSAKNRQQHIILRLKRLLQEKHDRELSIQIDRVRIEELDKMRREVDEHYRTQLLQSQLALERDYKQRCAEVTEREHQLNTQYSQRQSEFEHEEHIKRSKLLLEVEKLAEHERDLERRHQARRDELNNIETQLAAVQTDLNIQREAVRKRENKLKQLQSVFDESERDRRQHFANELEHQRRIFDDENRRLRHQIDEIVGRNDFLVRENEDLRRRVAESSTNAGERNVRQFDGRPTGTRTNRVPTSAVQSGFNNGVMMRKRQINLVNGNKDADDSQETAETMKKELSYLRRHFRLLKQRYLAISEQGADSREESRTRFDSNFSTGSNDEQPNHRTSTGHKQDRRRQRRNEAYNFKSEKKVSNNRRRTQPADENSRSTGQDDTQKLLNELTTHFKAQDALKNELAQEINRGIQRLALSANSTGVAPSALVIPASAEASLNTSFEQRRTPAAATTAEGLEFFSHRLDTGRRERQSPVPKAVFDSNSAFVKTFATKYDSAEFQRSYAANTNFMPPVDVYKPVSQSAIEKLPVFTGVTNTPTVTGATADARPLTTAFANKAGDNFSASSRLDDEPEQIYEIRRLEKRLEQSIANDAVKKRRRKVNKTSAAQQAPPIVNVASAEVFDARLQQQEQQQRSTSSPATIIMPTPPTTATSTEISLGFEDVQLRQLIAQRNRLDEYMFRPLPPMEIPKVLSSTAKARIFGAGNSGVETTNQLSNNNDDEQQRNSATVIGNSVRDTSRGANRDAYSSLHTIAGVKLPVRGPSVDLISTVKSDFGEKQVAAAAAHAGTELVVNSDENDDEESYMNIFQRKRVSSAAAASQPIGENDLLFSAPDVHDDNFAVGKRASPAPEFRDNEPLEENWFRQIRQQSIPVEQEQNIPVERIDEPQRNDSLNFGEVLDETTAGNDGSTASENDEEDAW